MKRIIPLVDLKTQYQAIRKEISDSFQGIFKKMQLTFGENVTALEEEFAAFCGVPYAVGVSSGTEALHYSLRALGVEKGDEVITTPFTFVGTVEPILQLGARPVFVDIDPASFTLDPWAVQKKVTRKTKAIVPVHLYGQPCEMKPLLSISEKYGIPLIEDAAQAHGAMEDGKKVGSLGKLGCFSFYPSKNLGCYGEGGMVITRDRGLAGKIFLFRNHGATTKYTHEALGFNGRLDEIQAAVLRIKLRRLSRWNALRRRHAEDYRRALHPLPITLPREMPRKYHVYHLFVIRSPHRDTLRQFLLEKGIETGIHYPIPLHLQKVLRPFGFRRGDFPESEKAAKEVLSLPMYPELNATHQRRIVETVRQFFKNL